MTIKSSLQNRIRGWLPREAVPVLQKTADRFSPMGRWTARALIVGTAASAGLLVLGDVAGLTQGIGTYLWPTAVIGTVWGLVAAVPFLVVQRENKGRLRHA